MRLECAHIDHQTIAACSTKLGNLAAFDGVKSVGLYSVHDNGRAITGQPKIYQTLSVLLYYQDRPVSPLDTPALEPPVPSWIVDYEVPHQTCCPCYGRSGARRFDYFE
jgi:hypothetical protein